MISYSTAGVVMITFRDVFLPLRILAQHLLQIAITSSSSEDCNNRYAGDGMFGSQINTVWLYSSADI